MLQFIVLSILYILLLYIDFTYNRNFTLQIKDMDNIYSIKQHVSQLVKSRLGDVSLHLSYNDVDSDLKAKIDTVTQEIQQYLANINKKSKVLPIPVMTEINVTGTNRKNSELIYFTRHVDAPFGIVPCRVIRVLVGINGRSDTETVFSNKAIVLKTGMAVVFDYDRSTHYVSLRNSSASNDIRITLKLQFIISNSSTLSDQFCSELHKKWATYSRKQLSDNQFNIDFKTRVGIIATYISTYMPIVVLLSLIMLSICHFKPHFLAFVIYYLVITFLVLYYLYVFYFIFNFEYI